MEEVTQGLGVEYLLLLGGPFAALIAAKQIYATKAADGEIQKMKSIDTSLKDVLVDDRGRADLVDLQYLLFNFVALAFFFASFAAAKNVLPTLPEGLVALTSASALAYVGKKAVDKNRPLISSVALAEGAGTPTVGDVVRIRGQNFMPAGAEKVEYLMNVNVRFDTVTAPVPAEILGPDGRARVTDPTVTNTDILVPVPPMDLTTERVVSIVVTTAAGIETDPAYQLAIAPKTLTPQFPMTITPAKPFRMTIPNLPIGTLVQVEIGGFTQDATIGSDQTITLTAPTGLKGTSAVKLKAKGSYETTRLVPVK